MNAAKRNRAKNGVGKGRGVPVRLASAIARKYSLTHIAIFTLDDQKRSRILYFARNDEGAAACANFCQEMASLDGWPDKVDQFDSSSIRRLKARNKELETALAQIVEGEPDAIRLARAAGKFPDEGEEENLGRWVFYPQGKLTQRQGNFTQAGPK